MKNKRFSPICLVVVLILVVSLSLPAPAKAAGVVGDGTP